MTDKISKKEPGKEDEEDNKWSNKRPRWDLSPEEDLIYKRQCDRTALTEESVLNEEISEDLLAQTFAALEKLSDINLKISLKTKR